MHITKLMKDFKAAGRLKECIIGYSTVFITHCRNAAFIVRSLNWERCKWQGHPAKLCLLFLFAVGGVTHSRVNGYSDCFSEGQRLISKALRGKGIHQYCSML